MNTNLGYLYACGVCVIWPALWTALGIYLYNRHITGGIFRKDGPTK